MTDRRVVQRLSGGELLIHGDAVRIVAELVEAAVRADPRLLTITDAATQRRAQVVRDLLYARTSATTSDVGTAEDVRGDNPPPSAETATVSAPEAARMLEVTTRRVTELCYLGHLDGEQDAPRRPWRIVLDSIHAYQRQRAA